MQAIFNNPVFSSRFPRLYGKTVKWHGSDQEKNYDPDKNLYGPKDIEYTFNKHGFRCDDFIESDIRIVFLGCSVTEGIGVRYTEVWAHQIIEKIRADTNLEIPFWNLAMGGSGLDALVRAYYHYHDLLRPHIVIALLPGYRREIFIPEDDTDIPVFIQGNSDVFKKYDILIDPRNIHYETEKNLAMLDLMLKKHNTKMLWNSWGDEYYPKDYHHRHKMIINFDCKGRDKMHPGPDAHQKFATELYHRYREEILSKIRSINCGVS